MAIRVSNKPFVTYTDKEYKDQKYTYPTYAKIKSELRKLLAESYNNEVFIIRTRRGERGQYYEYWSLEDSKLQITKKGWM